MAATKRAKAARTSKKNAPKKRAKPAARRSAKRAPAKKGTKKGASFGRPGTAGKGEGHAAVKAWIAKVQPAHKAIVSRIDKIVAEEVPDTRYAIKWSTPMFGREGIGWYAAMASFKQHVLVNFFHGTALKPEPPHGSSQKMRSVRIESLDELDEKQLRAWMRQASTTSGWGKV